MELFENRQKALVVNTWVPEIKNGPAPGTLSEVDDDVGSSMRAAAAVADDAHVNGAFG
jgi:hypothetical protein